METRTIRFRVESYGKAPKAYGANAYKFSMGDRGVLKRNGWTFLGSGRSYDYLAAPEGHRGRSVIVSAAVPTDAEIEAMALRLHAAGKSIVQEVDGFITAYIGTTTHQVTGFNFSATEWGTPVEPYSFDTPSKFEFGLDCSWGIHLEWTDESESPRWFRRGEEVLPET